MYYIAYDPRRTIHFYKKIECTLFGHILGPGHLKQTAARVDAARWNNVAVVKDLTDQVIRYIDVLHFVPVCTNCAHERDDPTRNLLREVQKTRHVLAWSTLMWNRWKPTVRQKLVGLAAQQFSDRHVVGVACRSQTRNQRRDSLPRQNNSGHFIGNKITRDHTQPRPTRTVGSCADSTPRGDPLIWIVVGSSNGHLAKKAVTIALSSGLGATAIMMCTIERSYPANTHNACCVIAYMLTLIGPGGIAGIRD